MVRLLKRRTARQEPDDQIKKIRNPFPLLPLIVAMECLGFSARDELYATILRQLLVNMYQTPTAAMATIDQYDSADEVEIGMDHGSDDGLDFNPYLY
jgi:hypothetical protein